MLMNPIRHHGSVSSFVLAAYLGLFLSSCQEGTTPAGPDTWPVITDPRHLPVPTLARTVDPGLREARIVLMGCLNRVQTVLRLRAPLFTDFQRDDWHTVESECVEAFVEPGPGCSYTYRVCPTGDGWVWEAYRDGCAGLPGEEDGDSLLTCRIMSRPYGASGACTHWTRAGATGHDSDWVLSPDGRTCDWSFFAGSRGASPPVLELRLAARDDGLKDVRAVCGDTVSWEGSISDQGDRGEMWVYGRARRGDPWILRHQIRWAGGHGEWAPEGRVW